MTILYNAHTDGDNYRITKFSDGEVESSYLCSTTECQCPAGQRPSCRHRLMLPMFIARGAVNSFWFLDWQRKGWVSNELKEPAMHWTDPETAIANCERSELGSTQGEPELTGFQEEQILMGFHQPELVCEGTKTGRFEPSTKPSWRRL